MIKFRIFTLGNIYRRIRAEMNTKLTLTIDHDVIEKAKEYTRKNGNSLSDIVENYLKVITVGIDKKKFEITPIVKSLKGSFQDSNDLDYKRALSKKLSEKYL